MKIKQWQVENGIAKPCNPFTFQSVSLYSGDVSEENYKWAEFDRFAQQHTFATDASNGIHSAEMFGEVEWQFQTEAGANPGEWHNCTDHYFYEDSGWKTRQFIPFNHPVEPNDKQWVDADAKFEALLRRNGIFEYDVRILNVIKQLTVQPINPNANAIKIVSDRIEELEADIKNNGNFPDYYKAKISELNHILKLLQS